jgi:hypothetical protein
MRTKLFCAALIGVTALTAAAPADARINHRQYRQQQRIANGVHSGALNARETYRLERREGHIARYEARSRADGGGLSGRERYRIERMQDRTSRAIHRQKHDRQMR